MVLPNGYTQLAYIQSSGSQYINTNFVPNQNTRVVFDGIINKANSGSAYGFGVRTSGWSNAIAAGATKEGYLQCGYANSSNSSTVATDTRCTIDIDCGLFKITQNGTVVYSYDFGSKTFTSPSNLYLFTLNNNGSVYNSASATLYSCKIYDNDVLVRDFIPCKNASGTAGLWDDVNSVFYSNAGTGSFVVGEMPKVHKTFINGTSYEITGGKTLIDGTGHNIKKGRTLIGGTGYDIKLGSPIGDLPVGTSVFTNVNGVLKEFIVVHQGIPDSTLYDASCKGTWLLMKEPYEMRFWHSSMKNVYSQSYLHAYLNGAFLDLFDVNVKTQIKTVRIPHCAGMNSKTVYSGSNGLSAKIFLLAGCEINWTKEINNTFPDDGSCLSYFNGYGETDSRLIVYFNGTPVGWWLRSPLTSDVEDYYRVWCVERNGYRVICSPNSSTLTAFRDVGNAVRPAMILPFETLVNNDFIIMP